MAKEIINEDFEIPEHLLEKGNEVERTAPAAESEYEIEVVDDTPSADQNRKPLATAEDQEEHEEELERYSDKVQKRINQMSHKYHDERRAKEQAIREREEALRYAQALHAENQRAVETLNWGQQEYVKSEAAKIDMAQQLAEDKYRKAYENGDTEGTLTAHKELSALAVERDKLAYRVQQAVSAQRPNTLQTPQAPVYSPQPQPEVSAPTPDPRAQDWAAKNQWFGKDEEMTSLAYGIHQRLVNEGMDPTSDEYYAQIDSGIRDRFPEKFQRSKKSSPVAPAGRSTAPKKVTLTASQVAIAKRLGVPLEVYAKHAAKEQKING